jgi:TonB-dependent SusC/RagA subfamily outer membrane receptor
LKTLLLAILHVEVLKDAASAAIYGTEGANGVVIITTKQGKWVILLLQFQFTTQSVRDQMELMDASQLLLTLMKQVMLQ